MPKEPIALNSIAQQHKELLAGALVGLGVVALVQMLSLNSLDTPLKVSVFSFAISIPALSGGLLCVLQENMYGFRVRDRFVWSSLLIGRVGSYMGICGLFFHFHKYAGIIFIALSVLTFVLGVRYTFALRAGREN